MTSPSALSRVAFSGRAPASKASAASRLFLASRESTVITSASLSSRAVLPETSSLVIAVSTMRMVPDVISSRDRIASVRSCLSRSFNPIGLSSHDNERGGAMSFVVRNAQVPILPAGHEPITILHFSDLHLTPTFKREIKDIKSFVDLKPDLVISTGDFLGAIDAVPVVLDALDQLLDIPGLFVFGSNDYY